MNMPRWFWWILATVLIIVIYVVFKINLSIGQGGFHITQGLIK